MELTKGQLIEGKVVKVDNQGLHIELEAGQKAFLPKQNMHVGKKKKLTEIFSEGYNLSAKILSKKKDYYVLTQKEEQENREAAAQKTEKKTDKKVEKKSKNKDKNKKKEKTDKPKEKPVQKQVKKEKEEQEENKSIKLEDLKKLKSFGSMKISVQKKNSIKSLAEEKKEEEQKPEILDIPENFLENIQASFEENSKKFNDLVKRVKAEGYLDEN